MKSATLLLGIIQALVAISALVSGVFMIAYPLGGPLPLPLSMLKDSPFSDFFLPGLILSVVIGLGHGAAAATTFRRFRVRGLAGAVMGIGLMIWIFVQVSMIGGGHWLQYFYFALGTAEVSLAVLVLFLHRNFHEEATFAPRR